MLEIFYIKIIFLLSWISKLKLKCHYLHVRFNWSVIFAMKHWSIFKTEHVTFWITPRMFADVPLEMNLFSETDNNALDEHLRNVLCTVEDTDITTTYTQVHRSTNEESNIDTTSNFNFLYYFNIFKITLLLIYVDFVRHIRKRRGQYKI
jgi:hypothetical protein